MVAVFRRGPTAWSHVGRWDLAEGRYEPGAWLRGRIFPRRSDLSPDGRLLCYFAHKPTATWEHGEAYVAVSRLPWLTALDAFPTCGTWTRGYHFTEDPPYGLHPTPAVQFANERRRGWEEAPDSPERDPADTWDERRNARMRKRQPGGDRLLCVESLGWAGGEFGVDQAVDGLRVRYRLERTGDRGRRDDVAPLDGFEPLDDLQWADWDPQGRLLAATRDGRLQVRDLDARAASTAGVGGHDDRPTILFEEDLSGLEPDPVAAPDWAHEW